MVRISNLEKQRENKIVWVFQKTFSTLSNVLSWRTFPRLCRTYSDLQVQSYGKLLHKVYKMCATHCVITHLQSLQLNYQGPNSLEVAPGSRTFQNILE